MALSAGSRNTYWSYQPGVNFRFTFYYECVCYSVDKRAVYQAELFHTFSILSKACFVQTNNYSSFIIYFTLINHFTFSTKALLFIRYDVQYEYRRLCFYLSHDQA